MTRRMRRLALAFGILITSCAPGPTHCLETRDLMCVSNKKCETSRDGCTVCVCDDTFIDRGAEPAPGQKPFPH